MHPSTRCGATSWTSRWSAAASPGATVTEVDGDDFVGNIRSRLGPLTVWFDGQGTLTERREDGHRARIEATGHERHGLGKATIDRRRRALAGRRDTPRSGPRRAPA